MSTFDQKYNPLNNYEEDVDSEGYEADSERKTFPFLYDTKNVYPAVICLVFSIVLCTTSVFYVLYVEMNINTRCLKQTSFYSPLFEKLQMPLVDVKINGSFISRDTPEIYRQEPSPEVDAAWQALHNYMPIAITSEEVRKLGKDPSKTVRYPEEYGLGPDAHFATVDVFHQIHCLDILRKRIHADYYYPDGKTEGSMSDQAQKTHDSHCIYIILQNLMCHADMDVLTFRWVDVQPWPIADFNIHKKCRSIDRLIEWTSDNSNSIPGEPPGQFRRPVDIVPAKAPDKFKDMFRLWNYVQNDVVALDYGDREV